MVCDAAIAWIASGALVVGCGPSTPAPSVATAPSASVAAAPHLPYAVATENGDATDAAIEVLKQGGDAVDAAVAAAMVLGVATPTACGVGGGGFAIVWRAKEHRAYVFDFREAAPMGIDPRSLDVRPLPEEKRGVAIGVPSEVAGLEMLVTRFGHRSFHDDAEPAIARARDGVKLTAHVHRGLEWFGKKLPSTVPIFASEWTIDGAPRAVGAIIKRPELAKTLEIIAAQGSKAILTGPIAQAIVDAAQKVGGTLTLDDLAQYKVIERAPLTATFTINGHADQVFTMPPPSAGGLMLLEALQGDAVWRAATGKGLDRDAWGSAPYLHRLDELMRGALDDRARFIGDPSLMQVDASSLFAAARIGDRVAHIDDTTSHSPIELRVDEHGTSHLDVVDSDGDAVALTTTVNLPFGARVEVGDTGIMLNDELEDFSPSQPEPGVAPWKDGLGPNAPRPGMRPVSSMTPTIVVEDGRPILVIGGSGGMRIATSVTAVAVARLVFGIDITQAIAAPRLHTQGNTLMVEPTLSQPIRVDLTSRGETLKEAPVINAVQGITIDWSAGGPRVTAASDERKGGHSLVEAIGAPPGR